MSEETLVEVSALEARLPFTLNDDDRREALGALEYLSDDVRFYGSGQWLTAASTPRMVRNLILRAAVRYMKNYEGFTQSRAGDESVSWADQGEGAGSPHFTQTEITTLRTLGKNGPGFWSVNTYAFDPRLHRPHEGLVPDEGSNEPIQMFSSDEEPW